MTIPRMGHRSTDGRQEREVGGGKIGKERESGRRSSSEVGGNEACDIYSGERDENLPAVRDTCRWTNVFGGSEGGSAATVRQWLCKKLGHIGFKILIPSN
jgi:hypothetical protein